jgi:Flp pilus assembly protein TadD
VHYNLGLLLDHLGKDLEAESALRKALALAPADMEFLHALALFHLKKGRWEAAESLARRMIAAQPQNPLGRQVLQLIETKRREG